MKSPERMNQQEHAVWWASLTPDEKMIAFVPPGYMYELVLIAYFKGELGKGNLTPAGAVDRLEYLDGVANNYLTPAAIAAVSPGGDEFMGIVADALKLDLGSKGGFASLDALSCWEAFTGLIKLNPSLLDAIRLCEHPCRNSWS